MEKSEVETAAVFCHVDECEFHDAEYNSCCNPWQTVTIDYSIKTKKAVCCEFKMKGEK